MMFKYSFKPSITAPQISNRRRSTFWWILAISILSLHILGSSRSFAQGIAPDIPEAGMLVLKNERQQRSAGTHVHTKVTADITGMIALVDYQQSFINDTNNWVEGIYSFPLPEGAAIKSLKIVIGERMITGEIKEKNTAKKIYEKAKQQGKIAALTTQQRPNLFTQKIANIAPGEKIDVHIAFLDSVHYEQGVFNWRLPTTLTPRYIPGAPSNKHDEPQITEDDQFLSVSKYAVSKNGFGWAQPTLMVPDADEITPPMIDSNFTRTNPITIDIYLDSGLELSHIDSLYHDIDVRKDGKRHRIQFLKQNEEMNRDFTLSWQPVASSEPKAAAFKQQLDGDTFLMLMLLPPQNNAATLARDIVFILDTSGSMQGSAIEQAKSSLAYALEKLGPMDRFNIIEFNSTHSALFSQLQAANAHTVLSAQNWVKSLNANGGTEMRGALQAAFHQLPSEERLKQMVFITDGAVGNETELFKLINEKINDARLFTVGIGSAPNSYFMKKAAEFGRGSFEYIARSDEVAERMNNLLTKLGNTAATNIQIQWPINSEAYPDRIGDLYSGEPLIAIAKLDHNPVAIDISGKTAGSEWKRTLSSSPEAAPLAKASIATLWARAKIEAIEKREHTQEITPEHAKRSILETALKHKILSRFTAFVAVDKKPVRPRATHLEADVIPNQVAQGQTLHPVMYPKTATSANLSFWLGALLFVCFMLVIRLRSDV